MSEIRKSRNRPKKGFARGVFYKKNPFFLKKRCSKRPRKQKFEKVKNVIYFTVEFLYYISTEISAGKRPFWGGHLATPRAKFLENLKIPGTFGAHFFRLFQPKNPLFRQFWPFFENFKNFKNFKNFVGGENFQFLEKNHFLAWKIKLRGRIFQCKNGPKITLLSEFASDFYI